MRASPTWRAASTSICTRLAAAFDVKIQRRNESFRIEGAKGNAERAVDAAAATSTSVRGTADRRPRTSSSPILEAVSDATSAGDSKPARSVDSCKSGTRSPEANPDLRLRTRRGRPGRANAEPGRLTCRNIIGSRPHLRHRPGRHRQDLSRRRLRGRCARAQHGAAHHPDAPGGRGRRAARLPARRPGAEGRPVPAPALRRALRADGSSSKCRPSAFEKATLEIAPLAFMRGRTLEPRVRHPRRSAEHDARSR